MNKKRKLMSFFLALMMVLASITAFADSSGETAAADGLLLLGDSIATGYGLEDKKAESYGALLAAELGKELTNLAVDGANSGDLLNALSTPAFLAEITAAEIIVISIGGNDLLGPFLNLARAALGLDPAASNEALLPALAAPDAVDMIAAALMNPMTALTYAAYASRFASTNLPAIVEEIKAANPNAALYIQTIYNPFGGVPGMEDVAKTADMLFGNMNSAIKDGAEMGYTAVDVSAAFSGKAALYTNIGQMDIHPNAAGHKLIFDLICEAINSAPEIEPEPEPEIEIDKSRIGEALGDVLYSDIVAYINGEAIPTNNIGGNTYIVVEDLMKYGFDVKWDGAERTLKVNGFNPDKQVNPIAVEKETAKPGTVKYKYYYTDVRTYVSGKLVESFNIDGKTLIQFDKLEQYGKVNWNSGTRELRFVTQ